MPNRTLWILVAALSFPAMTLAHHSNNYKAGEPVLWTGSIAKVSWDGAHVMYLLEIPVADGSTRAIQALGASPKRLGSRGIYKSTFKAGEVVTVAGYFNRASGMVSPLYFARPGGGKYFVGYDNTDAGFNMPAASLPE